MTFEEIISRFEVTSRNGRHAQAYCPAHEDRKASLSISQTNGTILLHCHAGCETGQVLRAVGLSFVDLSANGKPEKRIERVYTYRGETGAVLFEVVRFDDKSFAQRRPDGTWGIEGIRRALYRLPEALDAVRQGRRVYIVEGEKDADNLRAAGLAATTNPGGAGKWRAEYSESLRGARVCILPDNDKPGRKHAEHVARALDGIAAEAKILALPGLPRKGDVSDWLANGGTLQELERLADEAPAWNPTTEADPQPAEVSGNLTDLYHARKIVEYHGADIRFCRKLGGFLTWNGRYWELDETGQAWRWATSTAERIYQDAGAIENDDERSRIRRWAARAEKRANVEAALRQLEAQEGIAVAPGLFDRDAWLLNCANGTLDLRTGERREHRREDMLTRCIPVEYHADAQCPRWLRFLAEIFDGNYRLMDFIQRACGYALTGSVKEQKIFMLYGTGANGKSTFIDALLHVLGGYARRIARDLLFLHRDDSHPTALADLRGKRLAVTMEVEQGNKLAEVLVKELSGGDKLTARRMRQDYFEFEPTHKIFLCGNHRPIIRGTDHAIWRRIDLIPFTVTIPDDTQDRDLPAKLRAEASGILRWAVEGCLEWQRKGLAEPDEVTAATHAYRDDMDRLGDFLNDCCVMEPGAEVTNPDIRKAYGAWCERNGERPMSATAFGMRLKERGLVQQRSAARLWVGLGLKDDDRFDRFPSFSG
jgi:putative DNA primase/helicase